MVGIVVPAAAIVHHIIDTPYPVLAAYPQAHGVILPILGRREIKFAKQRSIESARSAQSVHPEGIVPPVLQGPFLMVDDSGRDGVKVEIRNPVGPYDHCAILLAEGIHELLHCVPVAVEVVGIQLECEASASGMMQGGVPVAADGVVRRILSYIHKFGIPEEAFDDIHGSVGGIVIDDNYIVLEIRLLAQRAADGIAYGTDPVLAGDDHRSLVLELSFREVHILENRFQICSDGLKMGGAGLFHLYLHLAVPGIHIVENLLAGIASVPLEFVVDEFVQMVETAEAGHPQAQVV